MVEVIDRRRRVVRTLLSVYPEKKKNKLFYLSPPDIFSKSTMNAEARKVLKVRRLIQKMMTMW